MGWNAKAHGPFGAPGFYVVIDGDTHSTVFSALQFLGLGHDRVRRVVTDDQGAFGPTRRHPPRMAGSATEMKIDPAPHSLRRIFLWMQ